jgi:hypothetical protein
VRELPAHLDAAHAVALGVERGRIDADAPAPGQHGQDAAAHPALGGHAHVVQPAAGVVVHAAGRHHRQHLRHVGGRQCTLARERVHAAVGQRGGHQREVAATHLDRALAEVVLQRRHRIGLGDAEVAQHPGDGPVAKAGVALGAVDRRVDAHRPADEAADRLQDPRPLGVHVRAADERGGRDGARVDHRIQRRAADGVQADRVEGLAGGLHAHLGQHRLRAPVGQRGTVDEGLGDRLEGEQAIRVTDRVAVPVHGGDADAEAGGIHFRQLGDVGGDRAFAQRRKPGVQSLEVVLQRQLHAVRPAIREPGADARRRCSRSSSIRR